MSDRRRHRARARPLPIPLARAGVATVAALSALAAMGASPAVGASPAGAATPMAAKATACDLPALAHHSGTVDIDFWESMVQANGTTLTTLTDKFNASQTKVHVNLVQQKSYTTTWTKYQAGLSNGQLPDVVQLTRIDLQGMVDSRSVLPAQACMKAAHYKTSDFIPRVLAAYKVNGVEVGMPFALSTPVLIYNKLAFTAAGISAPPATLHQMVADAAVLKAHGSGMGLKLDPWHLETWLATANQLFVNNGNGQHGRATKAAFDTATGRKIWAELAPMVRSGDATTNLAQGTGQYDNLLGIGAGKYAMSITTSAVLGTVTALLASGNYPNVQLGVAPFPVYSTKKKGGIEPGGSALYISNRVPTLDQAAAWDYIAFLDSTASQATWAAGTGYIPIRKSATKTPTVQGLWQSNPGYKVSYAQMVDGGSSAATAGAVIGPYPQVRQAELAGEEAMFQQGVSPAKAISSTAAKVGQILAQYNRRVGGS